MYKYPIFDLNFDEEEKKALLDTIDSKWISTGPKCELFENEFSNLLGVKHSLTVSSCTAALHMALISLNIKKGDEVIVPSLTFAATANVIKYVGAKPVFCDVLSYKDLTIDPNDILKKVSKKTKAIIVMHYAGFPCDMNKIMEIATLHNFKVIEDAAHAPLSEYKGLKLGSIGHIGTFSFFSNKNIATAEGGMIITNDDKLYNKFKLIRSHGMTSLSYQRFKGHAVKYDINKLGYNYRMDDLRASIGLVQLKKLKDDLNKRQILRKRYIQNLSLNKKIIIPFIKNNNYVSNYIFPVVLNNSNEISRDLIREKIHKKGIQTSVHYQSVHLFSIYSGIKNSLLKTEYISKNQITLPMYSKLTLGDIDYICKNFNQILNEG